MAQRGSYATGDNSVNALANLAEGIVGTQGKRYWTPPYVFMQVYCPCSCQFRAIMLSGQGLRCMDTRPKWLTFVLGQMLRALQEFSLLGRPDYDRLSTTMAEFVASPERSAFFLLPALQHDSFLSCRGWTEP